MYKVSIFNDEIETVIHSPHTNDLKLEAGTINKEINKIDSFDISFYMNNPAYGKLKPFKTLINVLNTKTNEYEFEGRILDSDVQMTDEGLHTYVYVCEGELGYLHDSQQKHLEFRGRPEELLAELLNYHNEQVEDYKRFYPGIMEVTTNTDNLYVYLSAESSTFDEIKDKILDRVGGELQIRKENGKRYLDVLERVGEDKETHIKIAKNLKSMSRSVDPTDIVTRLTPLGERIESEDEDATDASEARLTIEEVNNGIPYIDDDALIAEFGIQGGSETWDDITLPNRLLNTARRWLENQQLVHTQYELSALDLFLIGLSIDNFDLGNSHPVINPIMGIDERLRIIGKTTDINTPEDASLKIGDKFKNLAEYQAESNRSTAKVTKLETTVERQSKRMSEIRKEVSNVDELVHELNDAIGNADIPEIESSIENLSDAVSALTDAVDAIPDYGIATETTDGLMGHEDKVKLNSLENYENATETQSGLMSSSDKRKLDSLSIDEIEDIKRRLDDLENE